MKRIITIAAALCLVFGLATAEAGQRGKKTRKAPPKGSRTEMPEELQKPARFDEYPAMNFQTGVLDQEGYGSWKIGELDLVVNDNTTIFDKDGADGYLRGGQRVMVIGAQAGDTFVAWSVRMVEEIYSSPTPSPYFTRQPGANPNVGELKGRVE